MEIFRIHHTLAELCTVSPHTSPHRPVCEGQTLKQTRFITKYLKVHCQAGSVRGPAQNNFQNIN